MSVSQTNSEVKTLVTSPGLSSVSHRKSMGWFNVRTPEHLNKSTPFITGRQVFSRCVNINLVYEVIKCVKMWGILILRNLKIRPINGKQSEAFIRIARTIFTSSQIETKRSNNVCKVCGTSFSFDLTKEETSGISFIVKKLQKFLWKTLFLHSEQYWNSFCKIELWISGKIFPLSFWK